MFTMYFIDTFTIIMDWCFRFSKDVVVNVIFPLVQNVLENETMQGVILPPMTRLLAVMQFYATGNFQVGVFNKLNLGFQWNARDEKQIPLKSIFSL